MAPFSKNHTTTDSDMEAQQNQSLKMANMKTDSPDVVLREAYISAMDIAVERPLSAATRPLTNFAVVHPGLYRSAYPETPDYPFMRSLNLKTIVTLVGKELPDGFQHFMHTNQIAHHIFDMPTTKSAPVPINTMQSILSIVNDRKNYPLLVHCKGGKHRTGCVVGVVRKIHEWDMASIVDEYTKFASPKARDCDVTYLSDFKPSDLSIVKTNYSQVPDVMGNVYAMIMLASLTVYVWMYSSIRLLILTTS